MLRSLTPKRNGPNRSSWGLFVMRAFAFLVLSIVKVLAIPMLGDRRPTNTSICGMIQHPLDSLKPTIGSTGKT